MYLCLWKINAPPGIPTWQTRLGEPAKHTQIAIVASCEVYFCVAHTIGGQVSEKHAPAIYSFKSGALFSDATRPRARSTRHTPTRFFGVFCLLRDWPAVINYRRTTIFDWGAAIRMAVPSCASQLCAVCGSKCVAAISSARSIKQHPTHTHTSHTLI